METREINERVLLARLGRQWLTSQEMVRALGAPPAAQRKVMLLLSTLAAIGKVSSRPRRLARRGRPPVEFRRS